LVEHTTENRGVAGSIPALAIWRLQRVAHCALDRDSALPSLLVGEAPALGV
jgi:hypothetical protein